LGLKSSLIPKEQGKRSRATSAVLIGKGAEPARLMGAVQPIPKRGRDPNPSPLHTTQLDLKEINLIGGALLVPKPAAFHYKPVHRLDRILRAFHLTDQSV
jgi:hypothetical protein